MIETSSLHDEACLSTKEGADERLQLSRVPVANIEVLLLLQSKPRNTCSD